MDKVNTPTLAKDIDELLTKYVANYDLGVLEHRQSGHQTLKQALLKRFEALMQEVIGEDLGEGDDETFAYYENRLRAEQRQRLTAVLSGEEEHE